MVKIHLALIPRIPGEGSSSQGKSISKLRLISVSDGKRVNIPVLSVFRYHLRGDAVGYVSRLLDCGSSIKKEGAGKSTPSLTSMYEHGVRLTPGRNDKIHTDEKSFVGRNAGNRTINRHRWTGKAN